MIHHHIDTINELYASLLPKNCEVELWTSDLKGLCKLIYDGQDKSRKLHDQDTNFVVRDDAYNVQTVHVIDRIRKRSNSENAFDTSLEFECSWIGVSDKQTAGLLAGNVFKQLEGEVGNIQMTDLDNNTERVLMTYWGIDREKWGQNPAYNAWRIQYTYSLADIDVEELYELEGIQSYDPITII